MIKLGSLSLSSPLIFAPLAGFSDFPFRKICKDHGSAMTITELISAEGIVRKNKKTMDLMYISDEEKPIGIQIFGKDADIMAEAASYIEENLKPDFIDINMGCCAPKVCNGGSGAALTKDPKKAFSIADRVKKAVSIPVSAKIRIGWDSNSLNYKETISALEEAQMEFISVHGRTKSQKYEGLANWDIINEISHFATKPIIGNGDVNSYEEAMDRLKETNCTAIMIGRSALGNPWIFSGKSPSFEEIIMQMRNHFLMMLDYYGDQGLILSRKHLAKYIHGIRNAAHIRGDLMVADSREKVLSIIDSLLNN